jgi:homoserine kinase
MHQPYRSKVCPPLPRLLPLSGSDSILGVALSGAGPAVLLIIESSGAIESIEARVRQAASELGPIEILRCEIENQPAEMSSRALPLP